MASIRQLPQKPLDDATVVCGELRESDSSFPRSFRKVSVRRCEMRRAWDEAMCDVRFISHETKGNGGQMGKHSVDLNKNQPRLKYTSHLLRHLPVIYQNAGFLLLFTQPTLNLWWRCNLCSHKQYYEDRQQAQQHEKSRNHPPNKFCKMYSWLLTHCK